MEIEKDNGLTDESILNDLLGKNPNWCCKVENGYILDLKGRRKNKNPYDYNS